MELNTALDNIKHFTGKFARDEILCIREHRDEAIPELLASVRNISDSFADMPIPDDYDDVEYVVYAVFLLAEFRVRDAFEPFIKLLELDNERCDWLLGDVITEDMGSLVASVAAAEDIPRIKSVVENPSLYVFQRLAALKALLILYSIGLYPRADLIAYLDALLLSNGEDSEFISFVAIDCQVIYATEIYGRIRELFAADKIDTGIIGVEDFTGYKSEFNEEDIIAKFKQRPQNRIMTDTIRKMEWWACFNEGKNKFASVDKTITPAKTGRNAPCPCGSGKKYKKCCLLKK